MADPQFLAFLGLVALGALVQSMTGFALGLIVMAGSTVLGLAEIAFAAAVTSLIAMVNSGLSLRSSYHHIDRIVLLRLLLGVLPVTAIGVWLLGYVSGTAYEALRVLLGVTIILAGGILMIRPVPFAQASSPVVVTLTGCGAGLLGGLYGTSGPPLVWLMYRQPIPFAVIRATLLATFLASTMARTVVVVVRGEMTPEMLLTAGLSLPVVLVATLAGLKLAPLLPEMVLKRGVFALLACSGLVMIVQSAWL